MSKKVAELQKNQRIWQGAAVASMVISLASLLLHASFESLVRTKQRGSMNVSGHGHGSIAVSVVAAMMTLEAH